MTSVRPPRSARRQFAATMLVLEACVAVFATLVAAGLQVADPAHVWLLGGALAASLVLTAGLLRWPAAYVVGSVLQGAVVAGGALVPLMYVVGGIFAVLWVVSLRLGARIDQERAEREHAERGHPGTAAAASTPEQGPDGR